MDMNICYLVNEFTPSLGGWQTHAYNLAREIGKHNRVTVIAPEYPGMEDPFDYDGIQILRFQRKNMRSFLSHSRKTLKELLRMEDINILHPLMVYPVGYIASWFSLPLVLSAHGNDLFEPSLVGKKMIQRALKKANRVICVSRATRNLISEEFREKTRVIPNGVHPGDFRTDREVCRRGLGITNPTVLSVCRLVKRKGIDDLIRISKKVMDRVPETRFVIIGKGPEMDNLKTLAREMGMDEKVEFLGRVGENVLKDYLCAADVFVMPSKRIGEGDIEGFGIVFLEASASGTPVVGTRSGGIEDAIEHGKSGFLVDDGQQLTDALISILSDPAKAREMGEYGLERVMNDFSWENVAGRTMKVYEQLLDSQNR